MFRTFPKGIWSRWAGQPRPKPQHDPHLQTHLGASLANRTATHVLCWRLPVNPGGSAGVKASEVGVMVRQKCRRSQIRGQTMWSSALYLTFNQSSGCLITSCGGAYKHPGLQAWLSWPPLFQQSKFPHIPLLRSAPHPQPITTQSSPLFFIPSDAPSSPSPHLILFFIHFHDMFWGNSSPTTWVSPIRHQCVMGLLSGLVGVEGGAAQLGLITWIQCVSNEPAATKETAGSPSPLQINSTAMKIHGSSYIIVAYMFPACRR